jgi:hypothetical protein
VSALPTPYTRQSSFALFAPEDGGQPTAGTDLEAEFNAIKTASDQTQARLAEIQRDDGALRNRIVTPEALSPATLQLITLQGRALRGPWAAATLYAQGDIVTNGSGTYIALSTFQSSSSFATDVAMGRWGALVSDLAADLASADPGKGGSLVSLESGETLEAFSRRVLADYPGGGGGAAAFNANPLGSSVMLIGDSITTGSGTGTYTLQVGRYTKVGKKVTFSSTSDGARTPAPATCGSRACLARPRAS